MIMFFHTSAATGGMTKNGEITRMRTIPWPKIGWSSRSASRTPPMMVIRSTAPTMISVLRMAKKKAGFE
jgi:hypothetical protein